MMYKIFYLHRYSNNGILRSCVRNQIIVQLEHKDRACNVHWRFYRCGLYQIVWTVGLDMQHSLLVMKAIAQSHAASAVLHFKDPDIFKTFSECIFCERQSKNIDEIFQSIS